MVIQPDSQSLVRPLPQDINGDGVDDIVVGAPKDSSVEPQNGAIYIWYGYSGIFTDEIRHLKRCCCSG